ncbi:phage tail assembly protein [Bacillus infantis]|uniref:Phage tail assembly protein n=1 Tax=Bacillus infantis TaxID=324767 RepID=A0A5D4SVY0_9BACI|nr:phage tail assembly protein [Bacillus infantis]TYS66372.1 phage tail assembly protein [Bacillus infantis]
MPALQKEATATTNDGLVITFKKPYPFEGKEYTEVNLSQLEQLSGEDMIETDRIFQSEGNFAPVPEMTFAYACILAARASDKPIEFFKGLPLKESVKLKNMVMGFLNN